MLSAIGRTSWKQLRRSSLYCLCGVEFFFFFKGPGPPQNLPSPPPRPSPNQTKWGLFARHSPAAPPRGAAPPPPRVVVGRAFSPADLDAVVDLLVVQTNDAVAHADAMGD